MHNKRFAKTLRKRRLKSDAFWIRLVARVRATVERALGGEWRVRTTMFTEGEYREFQDYTRAHPELELVLGSNRTVFDEMDRMAHAHLLVGMLSSFTRLVAELNPDGVLLLNDADTERFYRSLTPPRERRVLKLTNGGNFDEDALVDAIHFWQERRRQAQS